MVLGRSSRDPDWRTLARVLDDLVDTLEVNTAALRGVNRRLDRIENLVRRALAGAPTKGEARRW